jgi:site-specific DNA recombinase
VKATAIYTRVSSDRQKEEQTIASQTASLVEHSQQEGYTVPAEWIFQDEGYSGATLIRPGLEKVRDLAAEGQIECVLIYSPDRLSRKYAYQVLLVEEFARHGVEIIFIKSPRASTPEEQLLLQFQGMIAEYERAQIAERTRRGKRYRAKAGSINVLSGAPYGFRYIKKTETSNSYYEIIEQEAEVVRKAFELYTGSWFSIGGVVRWLNDQEVPTRKRISRWERSTVWAMLRNPAYVGRACFGKTESVPRQRITRPLRQRGGYSPRCSSNRERPKQEWIEIPVPAIIDDETFALAAERLEQNKRFSARRTIEPTLLSGMLVCGECGYAYYRTSTRTSRRKIYYYRCLGSDDYRYANGRICQSKPIRQDYLDGVIWQQVVKLLEDPELIRHEIQRRFQEIQDSNPTKKRKEVIYREITRQQKCIVKLLDAYQEGLLELDELRSRMPNLRKRSEALQAELRSLEAIAVDQQTFLRLAENIEGFLARLRSTADTLDVIERQKILRLVVKEILMHKEVIKIRHSIPIRSTVAPSGPSERENAPSYLLCSGSHHPTLRRALLGSCPHTFIYYSGIQPLTDQAFYSSIIDPFLHKLTQDAMIKIIEKPTDI